MLGIADPPAQVLRVGAGGTPAACVAGTAGVWHAHAAPAAPATVVAPSPMAAVVGARWRCSHSHGQFLGSFNLFECPWPIFRQFSNQVMLPNGNIWLRSGETLVVMLGLLERHKDYRGMPVAAQEDG